MVVCRDLFSSRSEGGRAMRVTVLPIAEPFGTGTAPMPHCSLVLKRFLIALHRSCKPCFLSTSAWFSRSRIAARRASFVLKLPANARFYTLSSTASISNRLRADGNPSVEPLATSVSSRSLTRRSTADNHRPRDLSPSSLQSPVASLHANKRNILANYASRLCWFCRNEWHSLPRIA